MKDPMYIKPAVPGDLRAILDLIRDYERYDVEFARRYYDLYFAKNKITEKNNTAFIFM